MQYSNALLSIRTKQNPNKREQQKQIDDHNKQVDQSGIFNKS